MMETKTNTMIDSYSAEQIGNNEDILFEILLNLPTKALIILKLVSKQWMSLISSDEFCRAHTYFLHAKGSLKPSAILLDVFHYSTSDIGFLPLAHDCVRIPRLDFIDFPEFKILQSCNGLLLCASSSSMFMARYLICNPITRNFKLLSLRSLQVREDYRLCGVNFAFDPLRSPHYKIISVWQLVNKRLILPKLEYFIDIYSSQTSSWSFSKINFTWKEGMKFDHGVYFKGAIYWYSDLRESLYFDVENECLKPMQMPSVGYRGHRTWSFGESGGHLYLAVAHNFYYLMYSVFEMAEDHSHWYLKYSLNLGAERDAILNKMRGTPGMELKLFCVIQSEEEGDSMFIVDEDGMGICYNFKDCTRKDVRCTTSITTSIEYYGLADGYDRRCSQYFETLSCI